MHGVKAGELEPSKSGSEVADPRARVRSKLNDGPLASEVAPLGRERSGQRSIWRQAQ